MNTHEVVKRLKHINCNLANHIIDKKLGMMFCVSEVYYFQAEE